MYVQCMREELRDVCECDCVGSSATERTFHRASIRLITYTTEPCGNAGFYCVYVYPCLACMILFFCVWCFVCLLYNSHFHMLLFVFLFNPFACSCSNNFFFSTFSPVFVCAWCALVSSHNRRSDRNTKRYILLVLPHKIKHMFYCWLIYGFSRGGSEGRMWRGGPDQDIILFGVFCVRRDVRTCTANNISSVFVGKCCIVPMRWVAAVRFRVVHQSQMN